MAAPIGERLEALLAAVEGLTPAAAGAGRPWAASDDMRAAWQVLSAALGSLERAATKFGVMNAHESSIERALLEPCEQATTAAVVLASAGAGEAMLRGVRSALGGTLRAVAAANAAVGTPRMPAAVGVVWERCQFVARLPGSNKMAVKRAVMEQVAAVRDSVEEFSSALEESAGAGVEEEEEGEELWADDDEWAPQELPAVRACVQLLGDVQATLRAGVKALGAVPDAGGDPADADWAESLARAAAALQEAATDVGAALYAPVDGAELAEALVALKGAAHGFFALLTSTPRIEAEPMAAVQARAEAFAEAADRVPVPVASGEASGGEEGEVVEGGEEGGEEPPQAG